MTVTWIYLEYSHLSLKLDCPELFLVAVIYEMAIFLIPIKKLIVITLPFLFLILDQKEEQCRLGLF